MARVAGTAGALVEVSEDTLTQASTYESRRKGLTTAERNCFRRYSFVNASSPQLLRNKMAPPLSEAAVASATGTGSAVVAGGKGGKGDAGDGELCGVEMEKVCGRILDRLLPVPQKTSKKVDAKGRRAAFAVSRKEFAVEGATGSKEAAIAASRTPTSRTVMANRSLMSQPSGLELAQPTSTPRSLQMIRRPVDWYSTEDAMRRSVIRLIQGARASKVEREVGGRIRFVHSKENERDIAAFNEACTASGSTRSPLPRLPQQPHATTGNAQWGYKKGAQETLGHPLQEFRRRMLTTFSSTAEAFESINVDGNRSLDMREWCDVLVKAGFANMFEARVIFELMDADRDASLTMHEFNVGIETIAPVVTLSALRKRFICLGFTSMLEAMAVMDGGGEDTTMQPLTYQEFAAALKRVWVIEDHEHRAIFNLVRDQGDPSGKASLSDLCCGLAAVSPFMLIAEARSQLILKWGSLEKAYEVLQDEWLESAEDFAEQAAEWLDMTPREAMKIFRFTDIDRSGNLSRAEVEGVLRLSAACLAIEDTRRSVQKCFRGIEVALREGVTQGSELDDTLRFTNEELQELLGPVDMPKAEKRRLVDFISATSDQGTTLQEFFRGIRLFAPSCALEGVRLELLHSNEHVGDAFQDIKNRRQPLNREKFRDLLDSVGVHEIADFDLIFDILDVRTCGYVTLTELLAALRGSESGTRKWIGEKEREETIEQRVRGELAPLRGDLSELKMGLRRGLQDTPDLDAHLAPSAPIGSSFAALVSPAGGAKGAAKRAGATGGVRLPQLRQVRSEPTFVTPVAAMTSAARAKATAAVAAAERMDAKVRPLSAESAASFMSVATVSPGEAGRASMATMLPSSSGGDLDRMGAASSGTPHTPDMSRAAMRKTFQKFRSSIESLPPKEEELKHKAVESVRGYFASHQKVFREQDPLLREKFSKAAFHHELSELQKADRGARSLLRRTFSSSMDLMADAPTAHHRASPVDRFG